MRDPLCSESYLLETIEYDKEGICKSKKKIVILKDDMEKGIQRYPRDNQSIIYATFLHMFMYNTEMLTAKYSLGSHPDEMIEDYLNGIEYLENVGEEKVWYIDLLWMLSLGILLEVDKQDLKRLACVIEKQKKEDALMDFLLKACDIGWNHNTSEYERKNPYAKTAEIIQMALHDKDREKASKRLQQYIEKEWIKGHNDLDFKNAHKEPGYVGLWSFEAAALAKILGLDDSALKDNNHYPYDLAHYKNGMSFDLSWYGVPVEEEAKEEESIVYGIPNKPELEQIIPAKFHSFVNEVIGDYNTLTDEEFWKKYNLREIWFDVKEYKEDNKAKNMLGTIIVFLLVEKEYILQLDYKEDLVDYIEDIDNYWGKEEVKLISFEVDNDQQYYAYVPKTAAIDSLYEVKLTEVEKIEEV
ncbi:PoNi-like cognate immunity protein [Acetivibrio clariflavus]|uniref:PoNi-like cognate immunity protein n=1 Tax=Acetivibrio clariflavus TaxID=288965 RepID=UPI000483B2A4|nr:PoNi-like cognate immunity protein [Acetivibrio clariflavus]